MAAAKTRRVEARITLIGGDPRTPTRTPPGGTLELPAAEAETLVARRLARWASPSGTLPLTGGDDAVG
ncbi:hypothetical protein F1188_20050 [Roseospira marina]|uniref:Uncharacterized protein n=1 Tax=Roseospira marina TaxID=140057 RepID=A0A5M6I476_9PROT|nr:hypothetical protein [Roseospira marina]KAA5603026.1 hypothetical protein F1188_20050 [Roseospira marina]MBB4313020.1 hypothetical protein [Roseospira marina]MBB5089283.1 hypothetical protein [Roseospira marina]